MRRKLPTPVHYLTQICVSPMASGDDTYTHRVDGLSPRSYASRPSRFHAKQTLNDGPNSHSQPAPLPGNEAEEQLSRRRQDKTGALHPCTRTLPVSGMRSLRRLPSAAPIVVHRRRIADALQYPKDCSGYAQGDG